MGSLRARLLLAYAGLILVGFAGLAIFAGSQISSTTVEDFRNRLVDQAALLARALREPVGHLPEGETSLATLTALLDTYASQTAANLPGAAVGLLDGRGRYWLGNAAPGPEPGAPEVQAALRGSAIADTRRGADGKTAVFTAAPIGEEGRLVGIVWLQAPLSAAQSLVQRRWLALGGGVLALTVAAVLASLALSVSLSRPLLQLRQSALDIARGDFGQRLPAERGDEIGELARAFNHMADQVENMIAEQRAFASNASHELRTPLTSIRLRSEALRRGTLDEATARQYVIEIDEEVARLGHLVQDLITLSRLDAGRADGEHETIDAVRLAQTLARELEPEAAAHAIAFRLDAPPEMLPVRGSLAGLQALFRNVLSNAVKYTPPGGAIAWTLAREDGWLVSTIADTGQGIAPDDLPHIFERFYRADKARGRDVPGVGLGLSLVQMLARAHDGEVSVASPGPGAGTRVTVRLPLAPPGELA